MIRFILFLNRQGKTRLTKWYVSKSQETKQKLVGEIHRRIVSRSSRFTNFLEFRNYKIIYKRYAGLYFILGVDIDDNELVHLEFIHLIVELLDQYFGNVCELDLVFNFHKVHLLIDEMVVGGEIMEISKKMILGAMRSIHMMKWFLWVVCEILGILFLGDFWEFQ